MTGVRQEVQGYPTIAVEVIQAKGEARTVELAAAHGGQGSGQLVKGDLAAAVRVKQGEQARAHQVALDPQGGTQLDLADAFRLRF